MNFLTDLLKIVEGKRLTPAERKEAVKRGKEVMARGKEREALEKQGLIKKTAKKRQWTPEGFMPDFESMSDDELIALCAELEMEDACELDDEGHIMNRDALIRDLMYGHGDADIPMDREDEELDPVGHEDADINNDGKVNASDRYLAHRRAVRASAMGMREAEVVKFKQKADGNKKVPLPAFGGKQGDVKNKTAAQAIEDEIGDAGMKGMFKKNRPYPEEKRPSFKDWLTGNMIFDMTPSGPRAGDKMESVNEAKTKEKMGAGMRHVMSLTNWPPTPEQDAEIHKKFKREAAGKKGAATRAAQKSVKESEESGQKKYEVYGIYNSRQDMKHYRRTFTASSPEEAKEKALKNLHGMAANKTNRIAKKSIQIRDVKEVK